MHQVLLLAFNHYRKNLIYWVLHFWGMPASLNPDERNAYFGNQQFNNDTSHRQPEEMDALFMSAPFSSTFSGLPTSPSQSLLLGSSEENLHSAQPENNKQ